MDAFPPGRAAGLARLDAVRPGRYARSRNFLDGAVTRLSPYLRHGMLELAEVRDAALARVTRASDAYMLVRELAWRDYWRRVYGAIGDGVHADLQPSATGYRCDDYASVLPDDVREGATGLACIDAFVEELRTTGYVHNHARMWFASYVVHVRRVAWQAGARFYLAHLLDGDPASNSLSWQWVAGTFAAKPYIFNRENLERYTQGALCARCPLARGGCPFDAGYGELERRLFTRSSDVADRPAPALRGDADAEPAAAPAGPAIVWTHADALSDASAARRAHPDAPGVVAGVAAMAARDAWSDGRRAFVDGAIAGLAAERCERDDDDPATAIVAFARAHGATSVATTASPDPLIRAIAAAVAREIPVVVHEPEPLVRLKRPVSLGRFSRYWKAVEASALMPTQPRRLPLPL